MQLHCGPCYFSACTFSCWPALALSCAFVACVLTVSLIRPAQKSPESLIRYSIFDWLRFCILYNVTRRCLVAQGTLKGVGRGVRLAQRGGGAKRPCVACKSDPKQPSSSSARTHSVSRAIRRGKLACGWNESERPGPARRQATRAQTGLCCLQSHSGAGGPSADTTLSPPPRSTPHIARHVCPQCPARAGLLARSIGINEGCRYRYSTR